MLFDRLICHGYEQVVFCYDRHTGLRSIIVIHDTTLGPALGGVRMWTYPSDEDALTDCLRLARAMTYKAAIAGLHLGGGKSVIIGDPRTDKSEALLRAHGRFIQSLGGRYIPGIDVGTEQADMDILALEVARVSCNGEDPSPNTALGVLEAIRAGVHAALGTDDLAGVSMAIQGVGHVGAALARRLASEGARLTVTDVDPERASMIGREIGADVVDADGIYTVAADVFAPCAMGAVVNSTTLPLLRCKIIAGAANNVLADEAHAEALRKRGILYVPDYCANSGGLIFLEEELLGHTAEHREKRIRGIYDTVTGLIAAARADGTDTVTTAERLVAARLSELAAIGPRYVTGTPQPYGPGGPVI